MEQDYDWNDAMLRLVWGPDFDEDFDENEFSLLTAADAALLTDAELASARPWRRDLAGRRLLLIPKDQLIRAIPDSDPDIL